MRAVLWVLVGWQLVGCAGDSHAPRSPDEAPSTIADEEPADLPDAHAHTTLSALEGTAAQDAKAPGSSQRDAGATEAGPERDAQSGGSDAASFHDANAVDAAASDAREAAVAADGSHDSQGAQTDAADFPLLEVAIANVDEACGVPGQLACSGYNGTQTLVCRGGKWTFNGYCNGQTRCDTRSTSTQGTCQPIDPFCIGKQPGDAFCAGAERGVCGLDLLDHHTATCSPHAHCDADSASCRCDRGFVANAAGECENVDDCPADACSPGGHCVDGIDSFECACDPGFQASADKMACTNIDDCTPDVCGPGGTCIDGIGGYQCECAEGYAPNATMTACENVNDCPADNPCSPGTCVDGVNTWSCECAYPYYSTGQACELDCACGS